MTLGPAGTVRELHIYPIKSCRGISVEHASVAATGLDGDRQWQVSSGGKPVTQRNRSIMATVRPEPIEGGIRLHAPGRPTIEVARPTVADTETNSLISQPVAVGDAGDEAATWFAALLDDPEARLFALAPGGSLTLPAELDLFSQAIAFGDLAPVLVANTASLDWLAARADEPFAMDRFRANIVVATDQPFAEDTWARFTVGQAELRHGMAWPRCAVPQVDQDTGDRHKEPAKVLSRFRKVAEAPDIPKSLRPVVEGSSIFGVGCAIGPVGTAIAVGDPLAVTEGMEPLLASPS